LWLLRLLSEEYWTIEIRSEVSRYHFAFAFWRVIFKVYKCNVSLYLIAHFMCPKLYVEKCLNANDFLWMLSLRYEYVINVLWYLMKVNENNERKQKKWLYECMKCFQMFFWSYDWLCNGTRAKGAGATIFFGPPRMAHSSAPYRVMFIS
jgi:hypothetical protein